MCLDVDVDVEERRGRKKLGLMADGMRSRGNHRFQCSRHFQDSVDSVISVISVAQETRKRKGHDSSGPVQLFQGNSGPSQSQPSNHRAR